MSILREAAKEKIGLEDIKIFRDVFRGHGAEMGREDVDVVTAYARAIYEFEGLKDRETINPLVLLEKFMKIDQANENRDLPGLNRAELYVFFAQLNFEKLIQPYYEFSELETANQNLDLAHTFLEAHGTHSQKSVMSDYYGEGKLLFINIVRKRGAGWLAYSVKELDRLEKIEKSILGRLTVRMRIRAKRKRTDRPQTFPSVRRRDTSKWIFRKRFLELKKTRQHRKSLLEHRLEGCPGREQYTKYRLALSDIASGKSKNTRGLAAALRGKELPELEAFLCASPEDQTKFVEALQEGNFEQICWLDEWEHAFLDVAQERNQQIEELAQAVMLGHGLSRRQRAVEALDSHTLPRYLGNLIG